MSDDHNVYSLRNHTMISPVNPNKSLHSSLMDRLIQEGHQGGEQVGHGQVLSGFSLVGEKANTGIYIISVDTMDALAYSITSNILS